MRSRESKYPMKVKVHRIPWSATGRIGAILFGVASAIYSIVALIFFGTNENDIFTSVAKVLGFAVSGYMAFATATVIANFVAKLSGGIEIEVSWDACQSEPSHKAKKDA
jgi:hypothetical protein